MKSGHIDQFAHLSPFKTVTEFNASTARALDIFGHRFTKGERIAFDKLVQFSVKKPGICNARISKLVQAAHAQGGISRSTFERMLRKARKYEIITIHRTFRDKGGYSHNVYIFQRFDEPNQRKLTERPSRTKQVAPGTRSIFSTPEAIKLKKSLEKKEIRSLTLDTLDASFVPSHIPTAFVKAVKPFFDCAEEICHLWDRATIAHRSIRWHTPIESVLPMIIQAFKETVFRYKQRKIKTSFTQYFYGTVTGMLSHERRKQLVEEQPWMEWLFNGTR